MNKISPFLRGMLRLIRPDAESRSAAGIDTLRSIIPPVDPVSEADKLRVDHEQKRVALGNKFRTAMLQRGRTSPIAPDDDLLVRDYMEQLEDEQRQYYRALEDLNQATMRAAEDALRNDWRKVGDYMWSPMRPKR